MIPHYKLFYHPPLFCTVAGVWPTLVQLQKTDKIRTWSNFVFVSKHMIKVLPLQQHTYDHNQEYYRKLCFSRTAELWNLIYHLKLCPSLHLIYFKTALLICMFLRDSLLTLQVRIPGIAFVCNIHSQRSFTFPLFYSFQFFIEIILIFLCVGARSQS